MAFIDPDERGGTNWQVPADVQRERDVRALQLKREELAADPTNTALQRDVANSERRLGVAPAAPTGFVDPDEHPKAPESLTDRALGGIAGTARFGVEGLVGGIAGGLGAITGALIPGDTAEEGMRRSQEAVKRAIDATGVGTGQTAQGVEGMFGDLFQKGLDLAKELGVEGYRHTPLGMAIEKLSPETNDAIVNAVTFGTEVGVQAAMLGKGLRSPAAVAADIRNMRIAPQEFKNAAKVISDAAVSRPSDAVALLSGPDYSPSTGQRTGAPSLAEQFARQAQPGDFGKQTRDLQAKAEQYRRTVVDVNPELVARSRDGYVSPADTIGKSLQDLKAATQAELKNATADTFQAARDAGVAVDMSPVLSEAATVLARDEASKGRMLTPNEKGDLTRLVDGLKESPIMDGEAVMDFISGNKARSRMMTSEYAPSTYVQKVLSNINELADKQFTDAYRKTGNVGLIQELDGVKKLYADTMSSMYSNTMEKALKANPEDVGGMLYQKGSVTEIQDIRDFLKRSGTLVDRPEINSIENGMKIGFLRDAFPDIQSAAKFNQRLASDQKLARTYHELMKNSPELKRQIETLSRTAQVATRTFESPGIVKFLPFGSSVAGIGLSLVTGNIAGALIGVSLHGLTKALAIAYTQGDKGVFGKLSLLTRIAKQGVNPKVLGKVVSELKPWADKYSIPLFVTAAAVAADQMTTGGAIMAAGPLIVKAMKPAAKAAQIELAQLLIRDDPGMWQQFTEHWVGNGKEAGPIVENTLKLMKDNGTKITPEIRQEAFAVAMKTLQEFKKSLPSWNPDKGNLDGFLYRINQRQYFRWIEQRNKLALQEDVMRESHTGGHKLDRMDPYSLDQPKYTDEAGNEVLNIDLQEGSDNVAGNVEAKQHAEKVLEHLQGPRQAKQRAVVEGLMTGKSLDELKDASGLNENQWADLIKNLFKTIDRMGLK